MDPKLEPPAPTLEREPTDSGRALERDEPSLNRLSTPFVPAEAGSRMLPRLPAPLPRLAVVEFTLKDFPKRRVREAIETSDGVELPHVDVAVGHAGWIDMEKHRLADCERVSVGAELHNLMQLAFEMDRGLFNPRRLDLHARNRSEAGFGKLRVVLGDGVRGVDHFPPHRPRDHVEAELAGLPHVFQGMLLAAVGVARDRQ